MLSKKIVLPFVLSLISCLSHAQTGQSLGMPLNSLLTSESNPSISGNGRTMILLSTTGEDGQAELVISTAKSGVWSRPETVPNLTTKTGKVQGSKDYNLSYDANTILFSASKFGGVGGSDIWFMEKKGAWIPPVNPGKPINSTGNEMDPSLTSDGKFLYFVRADKKTPSGLLCGKIYVAEKTGNLWKEPVALPAPVNTGCECSPRILADNQTLIFASARAGGKGGLDLYRSQLGEDGKWSNAVPLAFINTPNDDQYPAVPASGDFIYYTAAAKTGTDIFKIRLPEEFRPKKILLYEGLLKDATTQKGIPGKVVAYDIKKNKIYALNTTTAEGKYSLYLTEGPEYDFSASANDKNFAYFSSFVNLAHLEKFEEKPLDIKLQPISSLRTTPFIPGNLTFDPGTNHLSDKSSFELFRIQKLLQDNPAVKIEIAVHTDEVIKDTVSRPELTEKTVESVEVPDPADSTGTNKIRVEKTIYHNDITQKQAEAIAEALVKKGISRDRITAKGYGDSKPLAENNSEQNRILNRRTELYIK